MRNYGLLYISALLVLCIVWLEAPCPAVGFFCGKKKVIKGITGGDERISAPYNVKFGNSARMQNIKPKKAKKGFPLCCGGAEVDEDIMREDAIMRIEIEAERVRMEQEKKRKAELEAERAIREEQEQRKKSGTELVATKKTKKPKQVHQEKEEHQKQEGRKGKDKQEARIDALARKLEMVSDRTGAIQLEEWARNAEEVGSMSRSEFRDPSDGVVVLVDDSESESSSSER